MLKIQNCFCLNEIGGRDQNEDSVWPRKETASSSDRLFMVCDGVGGSSAGEVASQITTECFANYFKTNFTNGKMPDSDAIETARQITMQEFERYIVDQPQAEQMSTTLTLAYIGDDSVFVAWCGDSRIYHIRNGEVIFQSEDHSLVNELVKRGELSQADAQNFSQKNIILRAIQYKKPFSSIDTAILKDVQPGDYILLCSDGLLENVDRNILKQVLGSKPDNNLSDIIQKYCYGRTKDNYSMYLIELNGKAVPKSALPFIKLRKKIVIPFALLIIAVISLFLLFSTDKNNSTDTKKPQSNTFNNNRAKPHKTVQVITDQKVKETTKRYDTISGPVQSSSLPPSNTIPIAADHFTNKVIKVKQSAMNNKSTADTSRINKVSRSIKKAKISNGPLNNQAANNNKVAAETKQESITDGVKVLKDTSKHN